MLNRAVQNILPNKPDAKKSNPSLTLYASKPPVDFVIDKGLAGII